MEREIAALVGAGVSRILDGDSVISLLLLMWAAAESKWRFSSQDAEALCIATPSVQELNLSRACLSSETLPPWHEKTPWLVGIRVTNDCWRSASRLVTSCYVDLKSGNVSLGSATNPPLDSAELRRVRAEILRSKNRTGNKGR